MDLNKIRVHDTMHIRIRKNNPFLSEVLKKGQPIALYYEPSYHEGINNYIRAEYDKICHLLESNGITFIYFPLFLEHFDEYLQYFFPNSIGIDTRSLTVESFYKSIAEDITELPSTGRPMLLISDRKRDGALQLLRPRLCRRQPVRICPSALSAATQVQNRR